MGRWLHYQERKTSKTSFRLPHEDMISCCGQLLRDKRRLQGHRSCPCTWHTSFSYCNSVNKLWFCLLWKICTTVRKKRRRKPSTWIRSPKIWWCNDKYQRRFTVPCQLKPRNNYISLSETAFKSLVPACIICSLPVYTVSAHRYLPASGVLCLLLSLEDPSHLLQCHFLREAISGHPCQLMWEWFLINKETAWAHW